MEQPPTSSQEEDLPVETQPAGTLTMDDVQRAWPRIRAQIKRHNPRTEGLLNSSKLSGLKENTLLLGFPSSILRDMMEKESNMTITMDVLEDVLGQPLILKCVVTSQQGSSVPGDMQIESDGMVGTATRDLGGKISSVEETQD